MASILAANIAVPASEQVGRPGRIDTPRRIVGQARLQVLVLLLQEHRVLGADHDRSLADQPAQEPVVGALDVGDDPVNDVCSGVRESVLVDANPPPRPAHGVELGFDALPVPRDLNAVIV